MQNDMASHNHIADHAPTRPILIGFWVLALVGLVFLIGSAQPVPIKINESLAAQTTTEDWHGNVRRSR